LLVKQSMRGFGDRGREPMRAGVALRTVERAEIFQRQPPEQVLQPVRLHARPADREVLRRQAQGPGHLVRGCPRFELVTGREPLAGRLDHLRDDRLREIRQAERDGVLAQLVPDRARAARHQRASPRDDLHLIALGAGDDAGEGVAVERDRHHAALAPVRLAARERVARQHAQAFLGQQRIEPGQGAQCSAWSRRRRVAGIN
jgi:hypothetical protein